MKFARRDMMDLNVNQKQLQTRVASADRSSYLSSAEKREVIETGIAAENLCILRQSVTILTLDGNSMKINQPSCHLLMLAETIKYYANHI